MGRARKVLTGAQAVAHAMRQAGPGVVPVYPITPQTPIVEEFSRFVADGSSRSILLQVESEHSALSAAVGAALAGVRAMTATASQGLALMAEVLYIASGLRAPVAIALGSRALSAPLNIHGDHSDAMLVRDAGAVELFAQNPQEAYDLMLLAPRLAEASAVRLPVIVALDGFTTTHAAEPVELLADDEAAAWVGPYRAVAPLLDTDRPRTHGPLAMPDIYFEIKVQQARALAAALGEFAQLADSWRTLTGRRLDAVEAYWLEDAERVLVLMGSALGTAKDVVDELRGRGERVGVLGVRLFRPFPRAQVARALAAAEAVGVLDRAVSPGTYPPLFLDVAWALAGSGRRPVSFVAGLGGRDIGLELVREAFSRLAGRPAAEDVAYLGLREEAVEDAPVEVAGGTRGG